MARKASLRAVYMLPGRVSFNLFPDSTFTAFLDAPSLRALRHGGDPLDAPDGLGLQSRTIACSYFSLVVHKIASYRSTLPRYQSPVLRNARPPLRDPTALVDVLAKKALIKGKRSEKAGYSQGGFLRPSEAVVPRPSGFGSPTA